MKRLGNKHLLFLGGFVFALVLGAGLSAVPELFAQDTFGLQEVEDSVDLASGDIRIVIARIIRAVLGLLGIIAIGVVLYGGYTYMTAGGNEEKVLTARKIITNGIIGLLIILASFTIVQFVINSLTDAIQGEETENCSNFDYAIANPAECNDIPDVCNQSSPDYDPVQCNELCQSTFPGDTQCEDLAFYIKSITPSTPGGTTDMNNIAVRAVFSHPLSTDTDLSSALTVTRNGQTIPMTVQSVQNGRVLEAVNVESQNCEPLPVEALNWESTGADFLSTWTNGAANSIDGVTIDAGNVTPFPIGADVVDAFSSKLANINFIQQLISANTLEVKITVNEDLPAGLEEAPIFSQIGDSVSEISNGVQILDGGSSFCFVQNYISGEGIDSSPQVCDTGLDIGAGTELHYIFTRQSGSNFLKMYGPNGYVGEANIPLTPFISFVLLNDTNIYVGIDSGFSYTIESIRRLPVGQVLTENQIDQFYSGGLTAPSDGNCLPPDPSSYEVTVNPDLTDIWGAALEVDYSADGFTYPSDANFTVNVEKNDDEVAEIQPISVIDTADGDTTIPLNAQFEVSTTIDDRVPGQEWGGVAYARMYVQKNGSGPHLIDYYTGPQTTPGSSAPFDFTYVGHLLSGTFDALNTYVVTIEAYDIDHNVTAASASFNTVGADCGPGDVGGDCGTPEGQYCEVDADCASGLACIENECTLVPTIIDILPPNGAEGDYVTILGTGFGDEQGTGSVSFGVDADDDGDVDADGWIDAQVVQCNDGSGASDNWTSSWVIVEVPENTPAFDPGTLAAVRVHTDHDVFDATLHEDTSIDAWGPMPGPAAGWFLKDDVVRPSICNVYADEDFELVNDDGSLEIVPGGTLQHAAIPGTGVTIVGKNFGDDKGTSEVKFGGTNDPDGGLTGGQTAPMHPDDADPDAWDNFDIQAAVPGNMTAKEGVAVYVTVNGEPSNGYAFDILPEDIGDKLPVISNITPHDVTPESYITISGTGFGDAVGKVFVADPSVVPVTSCLGNDAPPGCVALNVSNFPAQCQNTWQNTQIIAQIPAGIAFAEYAVLVERGQVPILRSSGQATIAVIDGAPKPSICAIEPSGGPAPLVSDTQITLWGANFADSAALFYQTQGSVATDTISILEETWLASESYGAFTYNPGAEIEILSSQNIETRLPVALTPPAFQGYTMQTGHIRARVGDQLGNGIEYEVNDCRVDVDNGFAPSGFHCCTEGPDAGLWKTETAACQGEERDAGYVWRFTTGNIPELPQVLEQCNVADWGATGTSVVFPSPSPSAQWPDGNSSCLNASIAVQFNMEMDAASIHNDSVFVYTCGSGDEPECEEESTLPLDIEYLPSSYILKILKGNNPATLLDPNTWYRVILTQDIQSFVADTVLLGDEIPIPLAATQPCADGFTIGGEEVAYCYDFKTTVDEDGLCELEEAHIDPNERTINYLGVILAESYETAAEYLGVQDAQTIAFLDSIKALGYYYIWGQADQACTVLEVDGLGWEWFTSNQNQAEAQAYPGDGHIDDRGIAIAKEHTGPTPVEIAAETDVTFSDTTQSWADLLALAGVNSLFVDGPGQSVTISGSTGGDFVLDDPFSLEFTFSFEENFDQGVYEPADAITMFGKDNEYELKYYPATYQLCFEGNNIGDGNAKCVTRSMDDALEETPFTYMFTWDGEELKAFDASGELGGGVEINFESTEPGEVASVGFGGTINPSIPYVLYSVRLLSGTALSALDVQVGFSNDIEGTLRTTSSTLSILLEDPEVTYWEPHCTEACTNGSIGVMFNTFMSKNTYFNGYRIYACETANCFAAGLTDVTSKYQIDPTNSLTNNMRLWLKLAPGELLEPNTYYLAQFNPDEVLEAGDGIQAQLSLTDTSILGGYLEPFEWKFKTQDNGIPCAVDTISVDPDPFTAFAVGQQTVYTALPLKNPDACSDFGTVLNNWDFGYQWSVGDANPGVATVSKFDTPIVWEAFCGIDCLPKGVSDFGADKAFCGNGVVDAGEECDIAAPGESPGLSCGYECVRPGGNIFGTDETAAQCGNGIVDPSNGEQCDPGSALGIVFATDPFCTSNCLLRGSSSEPEEQDGVNLSICGDGEIGAGEQCDGGAFCTDACLLTGTELVAYWCETSAALTAPGAAVACEQAYPVCGNGFVEPGEQCEIVGNAVHVQTFDANGDPLEDPIVVDSLAAPETHCSNTCLLQNICEGIFDVLPTTPDQYPVRCVQGEEGCALGCVLAGGSPLYANASICGDGIVGTGEYAQCEVPLDDAESIDASVSNNPPGQNPVQVVVAQGDGTLTDQDGTPVQKTEIIAELHEDFVASFDAQIQQVSGEGDYTLQCGFVEHQEPVEEIILSLDVTVPNEVVYDYNDCPLNDGNNDNVYGVGANTCCYPRPTRTAEYPADGAGLGAIDANDQELAPVCRNTFIEVVFDDAQIDAQSLPGNMVIASAHAPGFDCSAVGQIEITDVVDSVIQIAALDESVEPGFFKKIWNAIKTFFAKLFGKTAHATEFDGSVQAGTVWCTGAITALPDVSYVQSEEGVGTSVALEIDGLLDEFTTYAVLLLGESGDIDVNNNSFGIRDVNGVTIRSADSSARNDVWLFRTGDEICKVASVVVDPNTQLFNAPNLSLPFAAEIVSTNGQLLQSTPGYEFVFAWNPQENPVFAIPTTSSTVNNLNVEIGSKTLEGHVTGFGTVTVLNDISEENNHTGKVFQGPTELYADFCENPWPSRDVYPYEDGISAFHLEYNPDIAANNDGISADPLFAGSPAQFDGSAIAGPYTNFSMSYCADAGLSGQTADDLPYLKPVVITDASELGLSNVGSCELTGAFCQDDAQCGVNYEITDADFFNEPSLNIATLDTLTPDADTKFCTYNVTGPGQNYYALTVSENPQLIQCQTAADCNTSADFSAYRSLKGFDPVSAPAECGLVSQQQVLSCIPKQETLKKFLFFSEKDTAPGAIGVQVFKNPDRLTAQQWFAKEFPSATAPQPLNIDGYDAVKNGDNYYINAFNVVGEEDLGNGVIGPKVYNNIYLFSLDTGSSSDMKNIFEQLIDSLSFNINIPEVGYCATPGPDGELVADVNAQCSSNLDCYEPASAIVDITGDGIADLADQECMIAAGLSSTLGTAVPDCLAGPLTIADLDCSGNVTTVDTQLMSDIVLEGKFPVEVDANQNNVVDTCEPLPQPVCTVNQDQLTRDWTRLQHIGAMQKNVQSAFTQNNGYPNPVAGTFVPGYSNSQWGSWGAVLGMTVSDPVGNWLGCSAPDLATCWDDAAQVFVCPDVSSVYEYSYSSSTDDYTIHAPLEYFSYPAAIAQFGPNAGIDTKILDPNSFSVDPWCVGGQTFSPFDGNCGNGVVNLGEACEPGQVEVVTDGCSPGTYKVQECTNSCTWEVVEDQCSTGGFCGDGITQAADGEVCDSGLGLNGTYGHCAADCQSFGPDCGDGVLDEQEFCDGTAAGSSNKNGDPTFGFYAPLQQNSCATTCEGYGQYCGDGFLQPSNEQCDDGNNENGDGCNQLCIIEAPFCKDADPLVEIDENEGVTIINITTGNYDAQTIEEFDGELIEACIEDLEGANICASYGLDCVTVEKWGIDISTPGPNFNPITSGNASCTTPLNPIQTWYDGDWVRIVCDGIYGQTNVSDVGQPDGPICGDGNVYHGPDGIPQNGDSADEEWCDTGELVGIPCDPGYGDQNTTCSYCEAGCKSAKTVNADYCGDGIVNQIGVNPDGSAAYEQCEISLTGEVLTRDIDNYSCVAGSGEEQNLNVSCVLSDPLGNQLTPLMALSCSGAEGIVGSISCSSDCTTIINNCTQCGIHEDGTTAKLALVNPFVASSMPNTFDLLAQLYQDTGSGLDILSEGSVLTTSYPQTFTFPTEPAGLVTDLACSEYHFGFNNAFTWEGTLFGGVGTHMPYPVQGEFDSVTHPFIVSPPVPDEQTIRVVVEWPIDLGITLGGGVFSDGLEESIIQYANFDGEHCTEMELAAWDPSETSAPTGWEPVGPSCDPVQDVDGVDRIFLHEMQNLNPYFTVQAFTLNVDYTNGFEAPMAFHVKVIPNNLSGEPQAINEFKDENIRVHVYEYQDGQSSNDAFGPSRTFELPLAGVSANQSAEVWHVFSVIGSGNGYAIADSVPGDTHGSVETSECQMQENLGVPAC